MSEDTRKSTFDKTHINGQNPLTISFSRKEEHRSGFTSRVESDVLFRGSV